MGIQMNRLCVNGLSHNVQQQEDFMEVNTNEAAVQKTGGARLKKSGGGKTALIVTGVLLAAVIAVYVGLCAYANSLDTFAPNRHINGIDVGGLTVSEAQEKLETELLAQEITLTDEETGTTAAITVADLGYKAEDFAGDAQFWMDTEQQRSFLGKGWAYLAYVTGRWPGGANWPDMDRETLDETVAGLSGELSQEPVDGSYELTDDAVLITKARDGRTLNDAALKTALLNVVSDGTYSLEGCQVPFSFTTIPAQVLTAQEVYDEIAGEMKNAGYDAATDSITPEQLGADFDVPAAQKALDAAEAGSTVEIDATIEYPRVTAEKLKDVLFRDVLGECRTHVKGTAARKSNVKLSASAINGYVMNTGDVFSYNEVVGQRTAARGYQPAPAYVKGETVDEIGGGICQTSSTLYLACLRSNLEITERHAHRYIPTYIPAGMDATVSWGGPDYKFTNDTDYPIKIVTEYKNDYLTVKLLGTNVTGVTAKMTNEQLSTTPFQVVYEDDPTLAPGTEQVKTTPYTGSKWRTYRHLYDANGKLISSAYEDTSDYKARNKVILKGPAITPEVPAVNPGEQVPVTPTTPETPTTPTTPETPVEPPAEETPEAPIVVLPEEPTE